MINTLLKVDLPQAYGLVRPNVLLSCRNETGTFELSDMLACQNCRTKNPNRNGCNGNTMEVEASGNNITVVEYEYYMNQFNGRKYANGGRCDLMMFDTECQNKIVFCEMGCYSEEHVEKKQKKSFQQLSDSLTRFMQKQCGVAFINKFVEKVLIFGRRDPYVNTNAVSSPSHSNVKGNMQAFITTPISKVKYSISQEVVGGVNVSFVIINYPNPYIW